MIDSSQKLDVIADHDRLLGLTCQYQHAAASLAMEVPARRRHHPLRSGYGKLGVSDRTGAVASALRRGLLR